MADLESPNVWGGGSRGSYADVSLVPAAVRLPRIFPDLKQIGWHQRAVRAVPFARPRGIASMPLC
jgi:hypothetical protein